MPAPVARRHAVLLFSFLHRVALAQDLCLSGDVCGTLEIPNHLRRGCRSQNNADLLRIGLTTSLTRMGTNLTAQEVDWYNTHVFEVLTKVSNFTRMFSFCLEDDGGKAEQVDDLYHSFIEVGIMWLLGPADGEFNDVAAEAARQYPETRIMLWSLPWSVLARSDDFFAGLSYEEVERGETPQEFIARIMDTLTREEAAEGDVPTTTEQPSEEPEQEETAEDENTGEEAEEEGNAEDENNGEEAEEETPEDGNDGEGGEPEPEEDNPNENTTDGGETVGDDDDKKEDDDDKKDDGPPKSDGNSTDDNKTDEEDEDGPLKSDENTTDDSKTVGANSTNKTTVDTNKTGSWPRRATDATSKEDAPTDNHNVSQTWVEESLHFLPREVNINFDTRYTLASFMKQFRNNLALVGQSSGFELILLYWESDPVPEECAGIITLAQRDGFKVTEVNVSADLVQSEIRAERAMLIMCVHDSRQELVHAKIIAEGVEPRAMVYPKTNTASHALKHAPAYQINYNMEPTFWPNWEELLFPPATAITPAWSTGYTEWWYWHAFRSTINAQGQRDVIGPPPLIAHQLAAALQVTSVLLEKDYWNHSVHLTRDHVPWSEISIATFNGVVNFVKSGADTASRADAGVPTLRRFKPWKLSNNATKNDYLMRFYFSQSTAVVSNITRLLDKYQQDMWDIRYWVGMTGGPTWTEMARQVVHPLEEPDAHLSDSFEALPGIVQKEREVLPCRAGCVFDGVRCKPCEVGMHRPPGQLYCIVCAEQNSYADIPGLGRCRQCESAMGCRFIDTFTSPTALPNFYRLAVPDPFNESYLNDTDYCSNWGEMSAMRGPEDLGPTPAYVFAQCKPVHLCLGNNTCKGHNTGDLCAECPIGFTIRHKDTDLRECEPCPGESEVLFQLFQSFLILAFIVMAILQLSRWEAARIDSVQASLLLSLLTHLQVRAFMLELLTQDPYQLSQGAWHLYLGMIITRPFDLSYTDCLLDQSDHAHVAQGLLHLSLSAYGVGFVLAFFLRPVCMLLDFCWRFAMKRWKRFLASRAPKAKSTHGHRSRVNVRFRTMRQEDLSSTTLRQADKKYMLMYETIEAELCLVVCLKRVLVWTMVFYPVLVRSAAQMFWCTRVEGSGKFVLTMEAGILCDSPELTVTRGLAATILMVFGLGVPLSIAIFLHFEIPNFFTISLRNVLGVLIGGYKQRFYAWETVKIARTGLIILSGLIDDKSTRRTYILTICVLFVLLTMALEPHTKFHRAALSKAETLSSISLCVMIISSWMEELFTSLTQLVDQGSLFERAFSACSIICRLVERYGDVFFIVHAAQALFFSLVVLPVHIANRTGAAFRGHITTFLFLARWFYGINSVGVVTETVSELLHDDHAHVHKDTYLYVGSLNKTERRVIKTGIAEVLHVAVHNYDKFHPMLIVNALDEAAKRAEMARKAITLARQAKEEHGEFSLVWRLVVRADASDKWGKKAARSFSSGKYMDEDGYFTAEELYTTMQDVIMDIVDHHPLLKNVGRADRDSIHHSDVVQPNPASVKPKQLEDARITTMEEDQDEALFEKLVVEHEADVRRQQLYLGSIPERVDDDSDVDHRHAAGFNAEVDKLLHHTAGEITLMGFATRSGPEIHELQRCIQERKKASYALRRRLREELSGQEFDESVHLLGLHAHQKPVKDNAHTMLLSPREREMMSTGGFQQELETLKAGLMTPTPQARTSALAADTVPAIAGASLPTQVASEAAALRPRPSDPLAQPSYQAPTPAILSNLSNPRSSSTQVGQGQSQRPPGPPLTAGSPGSPTPILSPTPTLGPAPALALAPAAVARSAGEAPASASTSASSAPPASSSSTPAQTPTGPAPTAPTAAAAAAAAAGAAAGAAAAAAAAVAAATAAAAAASPARPGTPHTPATPATLAAAPPAQTTPAPTPLSLSAAHSPTGVVPVPASALAPASTSTPASTAGTAPVPATATATGPVPPRVKQTDSTGSTAGSSTGVREDTTTSASDPTPAASPSQTVAPGPVSAPACNSASAPASAPAPEPPASAGVETQLVAGGSVLAPAWAAGPAHAHAETTATLAPATTQTLTPTSASTPAPVPASGSQPTAVQAKNPARGPVASDAGSAGISATDPAKQASGEAAGVQPAKRGDRESPRGTPSAKPSPRRFLPKMVLSPKGSGGKTSPRTASNQSSCRSSSSTLPSTERRRKYIWSPKMVAQPKIPEEGDFSTDLGTTPRPAALPSAAGAAATTHRPPELSIESTPRSVLSSERTDELGVQETVWSTPEARRAAAKQEAARANSPVRNLKVPPLKIAATTN